MVVILIYDTPILFDYFLLISRYTTSASALQIA